MHSKILQVTAAAAHVTQGGVTPKEGGYIAAGLFVLALYIIVRLATRGSRRRAQGRG